MDTKNLIHMANQIGSFFEAMPDRVQATKDVASHLKNFWEPRMRMALLDEIKINGTGDLSPIVVDSLRLL
jgi:formate dehydrogenase subunit delta